MIILGLNAFHANSAAAIVRDGKLIAAAEEERFRRVKHWAGFPTQAIEYCLREARWIWRRRPRRGQSGQPGQYPSQARLCAEPSAGSRAGHRALAQSATSRRRSRAVERERFRARACAPRCTGSSIISRIYPRHFTCRRSRRRSCVGRRLWRFLQRGLGIGSGSDLSVAERVYFPHSLGVFYQALTQYLGFPHYGDEYKVMGLAPYGKPTYLDDMRKLVRLLPDGAFGLEP